MKSPSGKLELEGVCSIVSIATFSEKVESAKARGAGMRPNTPTETDIPCKPNVVDR